MIDIKKLQIDIDERLDVVMASKRATLKEQAKEVAIQALVNKIVQKAIQEQIQAIELQLLVLEGKEKKLVEQVLERIILIKQEVHEAMPFTNNSKVASTFNGNIKASITNNSLRPVEENKVQNYTLGKIYE